MWMIYLMFDVHYILFVYDGFERHANALVFDTLNSSNIEMTQV